MSGVALAAHQFRFDQKTFWRNPASVFFTVMLPVIFLLIFATIFGNDRIDELGGVKTTTYYVPAIITLAVVSATMQSLAISLTVDRERGLLKRTRGTPLPGWVFISGRIGNSVVVSVLMLCLLAAIGRLLYGVEIPWDRVPAVLVTLTIGAAAFCCLGIAITAAIPSEDAAAPITNVAVLPLYFLSGVFIPESEIPDGVLHVADAFPVRHFFEAFFAAWQPGTAGSGFEWGDLAVVAAWGIAGLAIALRTFSWTPRSQHQ
jgi:ABC-2 type transport system permease protein